MPKSIYSIPRYSTTVVEKFPFLTLFQDWWYCVYCQWTLILLYWLTLTGITDDWRAIVSIVSDGPVLLLLLFWYWQDDDNWLVDGREDGAWPWPWLYSHWIRYLIERYWRYSDCCCGPFRAIRIDVIFYPLTHSNAEPILLLLLFYACYSINPSLATIGEWLTLFHYHCSIPLTFSGVVGPSDYWWNYILPLPDWTRPDSVICSSRYYLTVNVDLLLLAAIDSVGPLQRMTDLLLLIVDCAFAAALSTTQLIVGWDTVGGSVYCYSGGTPKSIYMPCCLPLYDSRWWWWWLPPGLLLFFQLFHWFQYCCFPTAAARWF